MPGGLAEALPDHCMNRLDKLQPFSFDRDSAVFIKSAMRHQPNKTEKTDGFTSGTTRLWRMMIISLALITIGVVSLTAQKYINTRRDISTTVIRHLTVGQVVDT